VEDNLIGIPRDRDDGDEIDEGNAPLLVVDETRLALLALSKLALKMRDGDVVGELSSRAFLDLAVRSCRRQEEQQREVSREDRLMRWREEGRERTLQESTILADDLLRLVARQVGKRRRGVDDRGVVLPYVLLEEKVADQYIIAQGRGVRREEKRHTTTKNEQLKSTGPSIVLGFCLVTTLLNTPNTSKPVLE
jgi:hypothetical protein